MTVNLQEQKLRCALERRREWIAQLVNTNCWRWVHSGADGFDGLTLDRFANVLVLEQHRSDADVDGFKNALERVFPDTPVFLKQRWSRDHKVHRGEQIAGPAASPVVEVLENDLRYRVDLAAGEHVGLFLDTRAARRRTRATASGKRVLNLFSYSGSFGVAAASGGARCTVNVDNKESALQQARDNYRRNGLSVDTRTFFRCDVLYYLKRAAAQKGRFDVVIVDPPPVFKRHRASPFEVTRHYADLIRQCLAVAAPGGSLLAGVNSPRVGQSLLGQMIESAAREFGISLETIEDIEPDMDFPQNGERPVATFKWVRIGT